jgi:hypothetical protein
VGQDIEKENIRKKRRRRGRIGLEEKKRRMELCVI